MRTWTWRRQRVADSNEFKALAGRSGDSLSGPIFSSFTFRATDADLAAPALMIRRVFGVVTSLYFRAPLLQAWIIALLHARATGMTKWRRT